MMGLCMRHALLCAPMGCRPVDSVRQAGRALLSLSDLKGPFYCAMCGNLAHQRTGSGDLYDI